MTPKAWEEQVSLITDEMNSFVGPMVTGLSRESDKRVELVGTGTFCEVANLKTIITCDHVASKDAFNFSVHPFDKIHRLKGPWLAKGQPLDVAIENHGIDDEVFPQNFVNETMIASKDHIIHHNEILYFFGYSGQNTVFAFDVLESKATGYCLQLNKDMQKDPYSAELLFKRSQLQFSDGTQERAKKEIRYDDPRGLSGSLIWDTQYLSSLSRNQHWSPKQAKVIGVLKQFVPDEEVLLFTPIKKVHEEFLDKIKVGDLKFS